MKPEVIAEWLAMEGWNGEIKTEPARLELWAIRAEHIATKVIILAAEIKPSTNGVAGPFIIQSRLVISKQHQKRLAALPRSERDEFLWNMRFRLLDRVSFRGLSASLEEVRCTAHVYAGPDGELDRNLYLARFGAVRDAMLYVIWSFRRLEGEAGGEDGSDFMVN